MTIFEALRLIGISVPEVTTAFQIKCPFHKAGGEQTSSARVYPDTDSIYCFTCHKTWDVIGLLSEYYGEPAWRIRQQLGRQPMSESAWARIEKRIASIILATGKIPEDLMIKAARGEPLGDELSGLERAATPSYTRDEVAL